MSSVQFVPTSLSKILQIVDQGLQQDRGVDILQSLQVGGQRFFLQDDVGILRHRKVEGEPPPVRILCRFISFLSIPKLVSQNKDAWNYQRSEPKFMDILYKGKWFSSERFVCKDPSTIRMSVGSDMKVGKLAFGGEKTYWNSSQEFCPWAPFTRSIGKPRQDLRSPPSDPCLQLWWFRPKILIPWHSDERMYLARPSSISRNWKNWLRFLLEM